MLDPPSHWQREAATFPLLEIGFPLTFGAAMDSIKRCRLGAGCSGFGRFSIALAPN